MSSNRRNIVVGITVIGSLIVLGWMLLKFGGAPAKMFTKGEQIPVHFVAYALLANVPSAPCPPQREPLSE